MNGSASPAALGALRGSAPGQSKLEQCWAEPRETLPA